LNTGALTKKGKIKSKGVGKETRDLLLKFREPPPYLGNSLS